MESHRTSFLCVWHRLLGLMFRDSSVSLGGHSSVLVTAGSIAPPTPRLPSLCSDAGLISHLGHFQVKLQCPLKSQSCADAVFMAPGKYQGAGELCRPTAGFHSEEAASSAPKRLCHFTGSPGHVRRAHFTPHWSPSAGAGQCLAVVWAGIPLNNQDRDILTHAGHTFFHFVKVLHTLNCVVLLPSYNISFYILETTPVVFSAMKVPLCSFLPFLCPLRVHFPFSP